MHEAAFDLYWILLGAGGHSVRYNARVYEAIVAAPEHRARCGLYHAALVVRLDGGRYTIEIAPSPTSTMGSRGVGGDRRGRKPAGSAGCACSATATMTHGLFRQGVDLHEISQTGHLRRPQMIQASVGLVMPPAR